MATRAGAGNGSALRGGGMQVVVDDGGRFRGVKRREPPTAPLSRIATFESPDLAAIEALVNDRLEQAARAGKSVTGVRVAASHLGPGEGGTSFYYAVVEWVEQEPEG